MWASSAARHTCRLDVGIRDILRFASSRLGVILGAKAIRMLESGVASAVDIDRAMELGYRHPKGALKLTDLVGLDVRLVISWTGDRCRRRRRRSVATPATRSAPRPLPPLVPSTVRQEQPPLGLPPFDVPASARPAPLSLPVVPTWSAVAAGTERRRSSPITRDRSPRPPGSLPTGPAFGFLLAVFRVAGPAIPLRIAIIVGDVFHQLRSVFDHIAWAFASRVGVKNPRSVCFPVTDSPAEFQKASPDYSRAPASPRC